ncbi:hypothetical protein NDU88_001773 [Pleurodeles waltl]|uniref:Uncharacterized protein n=1 Tax=Pleurodeles waltl TaxID=8319 RepID=A0AAV7R827_PLEWA|nr:hypothetical protein NDU88_001773 [Pleurodeles waltl]
MVSGGKEGSPGNPKRVFIKYVLRVLSALRAARIETRLGVSYPAAPALEPATLTPSRGFPHGLPAGCRVPCMSLGRCCGATH